ncbi:MAG TPA: DciA family protein [Xanthobacteraceae bacterium]|nr:DciA family protein [Xanthobacteraceae bacterium]
MNKPGKSFPRPLAEVLHRTLNAAFAKQGFASTELVTRWPDIVGAEIAEHSEPEKIQWPRPSGTETAEPGVLVLRVEGPTAIEIQHLSDIVLERVNRFFGWRAVGALRLRQAPLRRRKQTPQTPVDHEAAARVAAHLGAITDENLRAALGRLGAAVKES